MEKKNKEKYIEEIALYICEKYSTTCIGCPECIAIERAREIYRAFVKEVFLSIEKRIAGLNYQVDDSRKVIRIEELKKQVNWVLHEVLPHLISEIKNEYMGGGVEK